MATGEVTTGDSLLSTRKSPVVAIAPGPEGAWAVVAKASDGMYSERLSHKPRKRLIFPAFCKEKRALWDSL